MNDTKTYDAAETRKLIPVSQFNKFHSDPSVSALRWMIFTNKDGIKRCIVRRGTRVLIDETEYFRWLDEHNKDGEWN